MKTENEILLLHTFVHCLVALGVPMLGVSPLQPSHSNMIHIKESSAVPVEFSQHFLTAKQHSTDSFQSIRRISQEKDAKVSKALDLRRHTNDMTRIYGKTSQGEFQAATATLEELQYV